MVRLVARRAACVLICVAWTAALAMSLTACGSGSGGDTQTVASQHSRPANWEVRPKAVEQAAEQHKRDQRLIRPAFEQTHRVARCLKRSGYPMAQLSGNKVPKGDGVVPVAKAPSEAGRLPVAKTGLRTNHGIFYVWIAPTQRISDRTYWFESGVAGGSERDHGHDGLVSVESERYGKDHAASVAELRTVASCAFSVPAASGHPNWTFGVTRPRHPDLGAMDEG
jgi:hypothetical protein